MVDRDAGTATINAETVIAMAGQRTVEQSVVAYPSLSPISMRVEAGETVLDLAFDGLSVTGTRTADGETTDIEQTLEEAVYDPSFAAEAVRLIPLEAGFRGAFQTVDPREGATSIDMVVGEQEEVNGRTAWLVDVVAGGGGVQTFAIDAETREVLRIRIRPQLGVVVDFVPAETE